MILKNQLFRFISFMLIITAFLPVVAENLPVGLGSFRYLWAPAWLAALILYDGKVFLHRNLSPFLLYGVCLLIFVPTLWFNMDEWFAHGLSEEFYWMATIVSVTYYYVKNENYSGLAEITKWALIFMGITAILTIVASFINPKYARLFIQSARTGYANTAEGNLIRKLGAGMYSFGQSLICLFPLLIYYLKNKAILYIPRWIIIAFIILFYIAIIRMQFFANILLASVVIAISFIGSKHIQLSIIIVLLVIFFAFIIPKKVYVNTLLSASEYFEPDSENYKKIIDIATYINLGEKAKTGTGGRLARYPMLYDAFIKQPILGNSSSNSPDDISVGYHLHWMGKLGATGLIGFLIFFFPHFLFIKSWMEKFDPKYAFFAGISFAAFLSLGLMKIIAGRDIWFSYFFIIPGMYYLPFLIKKTKS